MERFTFRPSPACLGRTALAAMTVCTLATIGPTLAADPFTPPDDGTSSDDPGGGSRGGSTCAIETPIASLFARAPFNARLARTTEATPTFRVVVAPSRAETAVFTLQTPDGRTFYRDAAVALPEAGGEVAIELPPEYALEPAKRYRWFLEVLCTGRLDPDNPVVSGQIERIEGAERSGEPIASSDGAAPDAIGRTVGVGRTSDY